MNQICAALVLLCAGADTPDSRQLTPEEFKQRALAEWKAFAFRFNSGRRKTERTFLRSVDGQDFRRTRTDIVRFDFSPAGYMFSAEIKEYGIDDRVAEYYHNLEIQNTKYKAALRKPKDKDVWILVSHESKGFSPESTDSAGNILPWLRCGNVYLHQWIGEDCFVITRIEPVQSSDAGYLRVHFRHDPQRSGFQKDRGGSILSGTIDFDQARNFQVLRYHFIMRSGNVDTIEDGSFDYEPVGTSMAKRLTVERPMGGLKLKTGIAREVSVFEVERGARIPEEEFRLTHYGLPEPVEVQWKKATPLYVWFLVGAGCLFAVAIVFWFAARRRK